MSINTLEVVGDTLYAGLNSNGVWKYKINDIPLSSIKKPNLNSEFKVYPNPAKSFIKIQTSKMESGELSFFDVLGNQVLYRKIYKDDE